MRCHGNAKREALPRKRTDKVGPKTLVTYNPQVLNTLELREALEMTNEQSVAGGNEADTYY